MDGIETAFDKMIMNHRWSVNRFHLFGLQANRTVTVDRYTLAASVRLRVETNQASGGKKEKKETVRFACNYVVCARMI